MVVYGKSLLSDCINPLLYILRCISNILGLSKFAITIRCAKREDTVHMPLNETLEGIISKEVYKGVKMRCKIHYDFSELPKGIVEKVKTDKDFKKSYQKKLSEQLQRLCYDDLEVIDIFPASNCLEIKYTAYYKGNKQYPEVHLKTLLTAYADSGRDVRNPEVFDALVERARQDLGVKYRDCKEKRLKHFATLFKKAIDRESFTG